MKRKTLLATFILLFGINAYALDGRQIMEKNDALPKFKTSDRQQVLLIVKGDKKEQKEFNSIAKRFGKEVRMKMTFTFPTRLGFLVWDEPGKDNIQWLKLSSGKVRKVASSDKDKPWMNSHFYNEDIGEVYIDDYSYKLVGEGQVNGVDCYKIEAKKIKGTQVYSKMIIYVGKQDYVQRRVEFFVRGRHVKTLTFDKIEKINGIFTSRKMIMERTDGLGKSILYIKTIRYNTPISDQQFKREGF